MLFDMLDFYNLCLNIIEQTGQTSPIPPYEPAELWIQSKALQDRMNKFWNERAREIQQVCHDENKCKAVIQKTDLLAVAAKINELKALLRKLDAKPDLSGTRERVMDILTIKNADLTMKLSRFHEAMASRIRN